MLPKLKRTDPSTIRCIDGQSSRSRTPPKKAQHSKSFALRAGGAEVYPKITADALEAALQPLVGGGLVTRLSRHDTNPANNIPIPEHLRQ